MTELLIFRLFGPFASWGEVAVGESRPSAILPTRSALLGLLGAALGYERSGGDAPHLELAAALRFAVRIDSPGLPAVDYHTVSYRKPERKEQIHTRADELRVRRDLLSTTQSWRHYRCDALVTVVVASVEGSGLSLRQLADALDKPVFALSLGRKACVPALPLAPALVKAATVVAGLAAYDRERPSPLPGWYPEKLGFLRSTSTLQVTLDAEFPLPLGVDIEPAQFQRRDEVLSRRRWRFQNRLEKVYSISRRPPADEEVRDVSQPSLPG